MSLVRLLLCAALTGVACQSDSGKANGNYSKNANTDNMGRFGEDDTGKGRYRCGFRTSMIQAGNASIDENGVMTVWPGPLGINISTLDFDTLSIPSSGLFTLFVFSASPGVDISTDVLTVQYQSNGVDGIVRINNEIVEASDSCIGDTPPTDSVVLGVTRGHLSLNAIRVSQCMTTDHAFEDEAELAADFLTVLVYTAAELQISITCK